MLMLCFNTPHYPKTPTCIRRESWLIFLKITIKLAWNLIFNTCANLIDFIKKIIYSQEFLEQSRKEKKHFTRTRQLPFALLVLYFCNLTKSSYQPELNKFFKILTGSTVAKNIVSKVALCKARKKLKYEAFTELNKHSVDYFNDNFNPLTWNGFFLKAVDGSTVKLQNFPEISDHFGTCKPRQGDPVPMARISQMFDPLNRITSHALISPKSVGEREMAASHFEHLTDQDLVLLDRGYPAFWLFKLILSRNAHFCSRISIKKWKVIRNFITSGKSEQIVSIEAPVTSIDACQKYHLTTSPMSLRLIRVELDSGEAEVLITSLIDCEKYPFHLFAELYHDRWPVEEDYKVMKCRIELENFSGKSALSVYQDFHARIFSKNITSMLAFAAQNRVTEATKDREHSYRVNFTQALSTMRDTIVILFQRSTSTIQNIVSDILETFAMATEPVRPGRKYPRNHKRAQRKYYLTYKPIL
jgi:DDE family transposase